MSQLVIVSTDIRQDAEGRYCLNDLHRASGGLLKNRPTFFLLSTPTIEMVAELCCEPANIINPVSVVQGRGKAQGTYVCKELVYAYAMWISTTFALRVIRAYDALSEGRLEDANKIATRQGTRDGHKAICHNLKATRLEVGKDTPTHVYTNECNMLNRIILGMTAKEFLEARGIDQPGVTRDLLTHDQLKAFDELQIVDASLVAVGDDYETRKAKLQDLFTRRHARALVAEFERMNLGISEAA